MEPFGSSSRWMRREPLSESKSEGVRAPHFEPATIWRVDHPQEDGRAIGAPQHDSHWASIEEQRPHRSDRAARVALNMRGRHVSNKDLPKSACGSIAVKNEVQIVPCDWLYPPVGPNRSVLIVGASCPSSIRKLETTSTKQVGPQTYVFGFRSGGKRSAANIDLSILRR